MKEVNTNNVTTLQERHEGTKSGIMSDSDPANLFMNISNSWSMLKSGCDKLTYSEVLRIYNQLLSKEGLIESIVLIGSVSIGKYSKQSDIDILVLLRRKKKVEKLAYVSQFRDVNIVYQTKSEFLKYYKKGYEFAVWCVKYGLVLFDKGYFHSFYLDEINPVSKDEIINKRTYINSIIMRIYESLANKDTDLGINLIKKMVIQSARIIIIANDIVPKSRGELAEQLLNIKSDFYNLYILWDNFNTMSNKELILYARDVYEFMNNFVENYYNSI